MDYINKQYVLNNAWDKKGRHKTCFQNSQKIVKTKHQNMWGVAL